MLLILNVLMQCRISVVKLFDLIPCLNALTRFSLCFAGQQNQQPQDYTKAWEEYYKKQGLCFWDHNFYFTFLNWLSDKWIEYIQVSEMEWC